MSSITESFQLSNQDATLADYGLTQQDFSQTSGPISHCGWHEDFSEVAARSGTNNITTGICADCEQKYFPKRA